MESLPDCQKLSQPKDRAHALRIAAQLHFADNRPDRALALLVEATTIEHRNQITPHITIQPQEYRITTESLYRGVSKEERQKYQYTTADRREKQLRDKLSKRGFKEIPAQLKLF